MDAVVFPNDNNSVIVIPEGYSKYNDNFKKRPYHESLFRRISYYLIDSGLIKYNIIDLGAWIGDNSLPWAKIIYPNKVYAIDPSEYNCNYIKALKEINELYNVNIIQKAISDKTEIVSTNGDINHTQFSQNSNGKIKLEAVSLDELNDQKVIEDIDYIHLDVEGMEYQVLLGASSIIEKYRPVITYEIHLYTDKHVEDIKMLLKSKNYKVYLINEILPGCNYDCRNCLAIPVEKEPENLISKMIEKLNGKYTIICHVANRCEHIHINNLSNAMYTFTLLNGGSYATILIKNNETNINIIKHYGERVYIDQCIQYGKTIKPLMENLFTLQ